MNRFLFIPPVILFSCFLLTAQEKHDYRWIIGYDTSLLDTAGIAIQMDFNADPCLISSIYTINNFWMEGSNTSMCDKAGNLLFYSNGCSIVNATGELMQNGAGINPGVVQTYYCGSGGSPLRQGVIALPAPGSDSLYYVFNLDIDQPYFWDTLFYPIAPQRVFYQLVDMTQDSGRGAVVLKNQLALLDTLSRGNLQAARHANGKDWWIVVPKSHTNCYFLLQLTAQGVQTPQLKCAGDIWDDKDSGAQAVFSPDAKKYVRFNGWNGLNFYDFDNVTGDLSNPQRILFPNDSIEYTAGAAISSNSRYLYVCARKKVYQFDLAATDVEASKVTVAEWDGFSNPGATLFYLAALAPDGKIYISSTGSTLNLHVIHHPDCPGTGCDLQQHGVSLPSYNYASIPNIPHYRYSNQSCDSTNTHTFQLSDIRHAVTLYPNPTQDFCQLNAQETDVNFTLTVYNLLGQVLIGKVSVGSSDQIDLSGLEEGIYYYVLWNKQYQSSGKIIKVK